MKKRFLHIIISLTFFIVHFFSFAQQNKIDSLFNLLKKDKQDTNKGKHLNALSRKLRYNKPDTAIILGNQSLRLAEKLNWRKGIANAYNTIGDIYHLKSDYLKALDYYQKALKLDEELKDRKEITKCLGNIGIVYSDQGDYPKALDYYFKALKINEELGNKNETAINLGNIGILYSNQGDYPRALDYYFKALKIAEEVGSKNQIAADLGNIGGVYQYQGDYPKALGYYFKALKMGEEIGDKNRITGHLGNIGGVYHLQENYPKALNYYFKSLKINEELGNKYEIAINLGNIGLLYIEQKKYKDASNYVYRSLALSDSIGAMNHIKTSYEVLSTLYEKSNISLPESIGGKLLNMEQMRLRALYYFKRHLALRDTLFSEENKKQLIRKEMNFDFEKKEAVTKAEQDKKDALAKEELKQKEQQRNYFIIGFALVAILAVFIFRAYRQKQKTNMLIIEQKKLVDEKQKEILDSIHYAKRIQSTLLPSEKYIERNLNKLQKD